MKDSLAIILFDTPWEHTSDYADQTSRYLCRNNYVFGLLLKDSFSIKELIVLKLSGKTTKLWEKVRERYHIFRPIYLIPFRRIKFVQKLNLGLYIFFLKIYIHIFSQLTKVKSVYLWSFNPEHLQVVLAFRKFAMIIYDCVDYHGSEADATNEHELLRISDIVAANSHVLYGVVKDIRPDAHIVPLGFDLERFKKKHACGVLLPVDNMVVGYIGGINSRIDFSLLQNLVDSTPFVRFVFAGPMQRHESRSDFDEQYMPKIEKLFSSKNVLYIPYINRSEIPGLIRQFDICIIPYDSHKPFNSYCFPMKVMEYFYEGKPVISTEITELRHYSPFIYTSNNWKAWKTRIVGKDVSNWNDKYAKEQKKIAHSNSWQQKLRVIEQLIDKKINSNASACLP